MRILLGITGGIAAYKAANLVRLLKEAGHDITVLPTQNALKFIGETTLEALSGKNIDLDMYHDVADVRHVELGQQSDLIIVAPATASFLARLASGIADDLLLNAILASTAPVVVAPAMHTEMWQNPATQANIATLQERGIRVLEPAVGRLTGKDSGPGRMPEPEEIATFALSGLPLQGKHVLVTAGGTREPIDSVRFIGNSSTGRMGIELAKAARDLGAQVTLVAANIETATPAGVSVIKVGNVDELELAMDRNCDLIIMAAAVSDFRVKNPSNEKLKRGESLTLELTPTKDLIASYVANHKVISVAFALSDSDGDRLVEVATAKLWDKGVDFIVGNSVSALGSDTNQIEFISRNSHESASGSKSELSRWILERVIPSLS
ncbi:bifunctional phosphopantothenoylcysteine decarboxylase/phosphopantothenate--cysteine ligase CoaBC [Aquiluna sp. KACHI24]|uniref:bifunctional phosphopantothenoylcysteine decarboxylase/phosphopantothenate--cysteine ligase CoaBC n=1 Tax=Aquiluna sp. KACHI24 TaxID=2968831 RepID=UPI00220620EA|nr:bifunctional phosphopantothenoylcysteine decarboxylase/phosphopantothenate--cysteine ligase CoaBC [Aquiluna sp. KACHI24]BDQ00293.1 coenzyme A biosynthesis bifunctional protein CoaBC [Aquiluna sp. KACHI24]